MEAGVTSSVKKNKNTAIIVATAKTGRAMRYRLIPLVFMAVISLNLDKKLYVKSVDRRIAAGSVSEMIMGIE